MDTLEAIKKRRSIRLYKQDQIEQKKIKELLAAAQSAPQASLFHITIITNKDLLTKLDTTTLEAMKSCNNSFLRQRAQAKNYHPLHNAPCLFLISAPKVAFASGTTAASATAITIAATALGLGSCYLEVPILAFAKTPALKKVVGMPDRYEPACGVVVGYSDEGTLPAASNTHTNYNYC